MFHKLNYCIFSRWLLYKLVFRTKNGIDNLKRKSLWGTYFLSPPVSLDELWIPNSFTVKWVPVSFPVIKAAVA